MQLSHSQLRYIYASKIPFKTSLVTVAHTHARTHARPHKTLIFLLCILLLNIIKSYACKKYTGIASKNENYSYRIHPKLSTEYKHSSRETMVLQ